MYVPLCNDGHGGVFIISTRNDTKVNVQELRLRVRWGDYFYSKPDPAIATMLCRVL